MDKLQYFKRAGYAGIHTTTKCCCINFFGFKTTTYAIQVELLSGNANIPVNKNFMASRLLNC